MLQSKTVMVGWLVGRLTSPFSTKISYIGDKVLGADLVLPDTVTYQPRCVFVQRRPKMGKDRRGSFKVLR